MSKQLKPANVGEKLCIKCRILTPHLRGSSGRVEIHFGIVFSYGGVPYKFHVLPRER